MKFVSKQSITLMLVFALLAAFASLALAQGNVLSDPPKNYTLVNGWYKGQAVSYYEFAANSATANGGAEIVPAPIYALITGFDADGNPQFVEGQNNIVDVIPGDTGYSAFWQVNLVTVPADYQANTFTSVEQVLNSGYEIVTPGLVVNCPVPEAGLPDPSAMADTTSTDTTSTEEASTDTATTDGATTETTTTENPSPTSLPATGGNQNSSVLLLIVAGLLALSAGIVLKFKTNTNNKAI